MPKDLGWEKAIKKVLGVAGEAMHYKAIAEEISNLGLRKSLGATPANTVNSYINTSLNENGVRSPFIKTGRGVYFLRDGMISELQNDSLEGGKTAGLIQSLGMFWQSDRVHWKTNPKVLGQQQSGSDAVDFCDQIGVYLLHDRERIIYVGRSIDRPMGQRIFEHTKDRLSGRWDRFSWFGLKGVADDGSLEAPVEYLSSPDSLISTMEAILIEALEPPQNRRRGDQLSAVEYQQADDPAKENERISAITSLFAGSLRANR